MAPGADEVRLEEVAESEFRSRVGQSFTVEAPLGEAFSVTLIEVTSHPHLPHAPERRRGFSIVLQAEGSGHRPQSIYRVGHAQMGAMELFLVPIGPRGGRMCYEAVFN